MQQAWLMSTALAAIACGFIPAAAYAQDASTVSSVEELVVTAQRRAQNLQDVPLAISAFGAEEIERSNAQAIDDIASRSPGVTITTFNIGEPQVYVRGVGTQSDSAASDPSIAFSLDEVPIGRAGGASVGFLDIQRVEVLRGPQGTLYGRNASAGALNIYTNAPVFEREGKVSLKLGSYGERGGEFVFNTPIDDQDAVRVAARYNRNHGYGRTTLTNDRLNGGESWGARVQFKREAGDWTFLTGADYAKDDFSGQVRIITADASTSPAFRAQIAQIRGNLSVYEAATRPDVFQRRENWGVLQRIEHEGEQFNFVSLTGYRVNRYDWLDDHWPTPPFSFVQVNYDSAGEDAKQFSQEFRFLSPSSSRIQWVAGLFFWREDVQRSERFQTFVTPPFPLGLTGDTRLTQDAESTSYAAFGQATVPFADIWEFTAGLRITHDKREVLQEGFSNDPRRPPGFPVFPFTAPYSAVGKADFTKPTWRLSLSAEPWEGKRIYVSYDRGYKSGSFVSQAQNAIQATTIIKPEILDNFDLGIKTTWFNKRLRVNADAFYLDYKDLQVFELSSTLNLITSNADARVYGLEAQVEAAVTRNITVGVNYTRLDTKFTTDAVSAVGLLPYKGNELPRSPKNQVNAFVQGEFEVAGGQVVARAAYDWRDDFFFYPTNNVSSLHKGYGLASASVSWERDDGLKIAGYVENATKEKYFTHVITAGGMGTRIYGPPRWFTLQVSKSF